MERLAASSCTASRSWMQWTVCATACADLLSLGPFEPLRAAARVAPLWVCCLGAVPWQLVSDCFSTHGDGTAGRPHSLLVPFVTRFVQCHLPRPSGLSASTTTTTTSLSCMRGTSHLYYYANVASFSFSKRFYLHRLLPVFGSAARGL